ncbi:unnamed protein product, partial [Mesorhabditis belari]|uniref:Uncharacterized protein n=1 Tax=Mesorhabditis belari TaxID=2138241 RepID=A0AAF3EF70_9BILA
MSEGIFANENKKFSLINLENLIPFETRYYRLVLSKIRSCKSLRLNFWLDNMPVSRMIEFLRVLDSIRHVAKLELQETQHFYGVIPVEKIIVDWNPAMSVDQEISIRPHKVLAVEEYRKVFEKAAFSNCSLKISTHEFAIKEKFFHVLTNMRTILRNELIIFVFSLKCDDDIGNLFQITVEILGNQFEIDRIDEKTEKPQKLKPFQQLIEAVKENKRNSPSFHFNFNSAESFGYFRDTSKNLSLIVAIFGNNDQHQLETIAQRISEK